MIRFPFPQRPILTLSRRAALAGGLSSVALVASGCGGGAADDEEPPALSAAQAAADLTRNARYPAALAVRVTPGTTDVEVRGVRRSGGSAATADDFFPVGSISKSMTATLAAVLVQQGFLRWDTRLLEALPELAAGARGDYTAVTLRDLLAHRSGLFPVATAAQVARLPALSGNPQQQRLQLVAWATGLAPSVPPRGTPEYSNGGYVAAGAMLEKLAGQGYEALLRERLFAPLGARVEFGAPGSGGTGEPRGHQYAGNRWEPMDPDDPRVEVPAFANPAGGVKLRGADLARYLQMHLRALRGETGLLLSPANAAELHTPIQQGFALGWMEGTGLDGQPLSWHNGSDDASYHALAAVSRRRGIAAAIVLTGLGPKSEQDESTAVAQMLIA